MKIIALPDLHNHINPILQIGKMLSEVDLVLLVGDLTSGGERADAERVVQTIREFTPSILAVPGNMDRPEIESYLTEEGINLHRRTQLLQGLAFVGMGASLPCPGHTPNEIREEDFDRYLQETVANLGSDVPQLLICHQPPLDTKNDLAHGQDHVGSRAVRCFIERHQPLICFCGHIHEGVGIDEIFSTRIVNPGPLFLGHYAYAEVTERGIKTLEIRAG